MVVAVVIVAIILAVVVVVVPISGPMAGMVHVVCGPAAAVTVIDHATVHRAERQDGKEQRGNDCSHGEFFLNRIVAGSHDRRSQAGISVR
jgi:hypothetical protein